MTTPATASTAPPSPATGLTGAEAARRLAADGPNEVAARRPVRLYSRVLAQLRDPLIMVLLGAVALTLAIGDHPDAIVIGLVVVVNTTVGVVQEVRADNAVAALSALSAPHARVRRDGTVRDVAAAEVVVGDVLVLGEGDIVAADALLAEASALLLDESMLTGESVPVDKDADGTLSAGTVVVRGRGVATVTATGPRSALGRIAALLDDRREATPLQRRLAALGRILAAVTLALCVLVFALGLVRGLPPGTMAVTAISLAVAAVPESLPAVVTLALALGARRMAARHALVRRLPAVETLGSVSVLATDKTGTLTEGRMVVQRIRTPGACVELTGVGYEPAGQALVSGRPATPEELAPVRELLRTTVLCNDATLRPPDATDPGSRWTAVGDPMEAALLAAAAKTGCPPEPELRAGLPRIGEAPFDSLRKRMTTLHEEAPGRILVCLKGAPEAVLTPTVLSADADTVAQAREAAADLAGEGYRVLAVASGVRGDLPEPVAAAESGLRLLGLVALSDPPKPHAARTLASCRAAGITPVLITGDHPATARAVADSVGLTGETDGHAGHVVTGADVAAGRVPDLTSVRVFARTDPQQKLDVVAAWRAAGAVTAMTGDGVNDGPALHRADIGVAMGARGTEVARQAADLVLTDDELSTVVSAVEEGRRVYDNIRRFLVYGMAGGAAEILVMLAGPLLGLPLPLRAGQILWINLLTHGLTGVAMGAEPASPGTMRRPPRPPDQHILGGGAWQRLSVLAAVVTAASLGAGLVARAHGLDWQSVLFLALLAAQLGVVLGLRARLFTRKNPFLPVAVLASALLALAALYVPFLRTALDTDPLGGVGIALAVACAPVGFLVARAVRTAFRPPGPAGTDERSGLR
ncbi:HAD-IC family P-type ATPase [Streptomyces sp. R302]|uniref:cation-translocating P-type ATPase n=1 Tax=unclassified Streptomyces TaxID=2593676 RepID=UPI00145E0BFA|nr:MULTISPECIES: HAD-IC family P-type ATPase [unclassified Streptomyces]NML51080.1 HAD-IC family P-type ATPase [Streptomyces sp. R301]NML81175.1 HAD-IC family P-type ATPase [Streptomyces sp. R302]